MHTPNSAHSRRDVSIDALQKRLAPAFGARSSAGNRDLVTTRLAAVSGEDCSHVFLRLGWMKCCRDRDITWIEHGSKFVAVPMCDVMPVETLENLLLETGISVSAFVRSLSRHRAGVLGAAQS